MSLSRSFVQRSSRLASNASSSSLLTGSSTSSRQVINAARAQYRSYSSNNGSSSSTRSKTPVAFGLVGLGGLTTWLGFGDSKDPKTTQEGMLGNRPDVDYGQVYRDVGAFYLSFFSLYAIILSLSLPSRLCNFPPLLIGRHCLPSLGVGLAGTRGVMHGAMGEQSRHLKQSNIFTDNILTISVHLHLLQQPPSWKTKVSSHSHFSLPGMSFGITPSEPGLVHKA